MLVMGLRRSRMNEPSSARCFEMMEEILQSPSFMPCMYSLEIHWWMCRADPTDGRNTIYHYIVFSLIWCENGDQADECGQFGFAMNGLNRATNFFLAPRNLARQRNIKKKKKALNPEVTFLVARSCKCGKKFPIWKSGQIGHRRQAVRNG